MKRTFLAALALSVACTASTEPGVMVGVVREAPSSPALRPDGTRVFTTNHGFVVTLTTGYISTASVEIFACATSAAHWPTFGMRSAYAHTVGSPTRLGTSFVESLLAPSGETSRMGTLFPPEGKYCRVRHSVRAADADAQNLPSEAMIGKSVWLVGTFAKIGGEPQPFEIASASSFDVDREVPAASLSRGVESTVLLSKAGERWFDNVPFESTEERNRAVLENLRISLGATLR